MTRGIFQAVNRFITSLDVGSFISNTDESGYFDITDKIVDGFELTDGKCRAYMTIDFGIEGSEEIFRINEVDGYRCYFDKRISVGGNGKQTHISSSSVRINDVAEYINDLSEFIDTFGYSEQLTDTTFIVHGGRIQIGNEVVELEDKVFTLGSEGFLINQTHTLFVNQTTKQFEVNAVVPETGIILSEIITDNDKIVSLTRKMPAYVSMYGYSVLDVNGKTGSVILDKGDIGLGNVDNTSDADKPLSNISAEYFNNIMNQGGYGAEIEGENVLNLEENHVGTISDNIILGFAHEYNLGIGHDGSYPIHSNLVLSNKLTVLIYLKSGIYYAKAYTISNGTFSSGTEFSVGASHSAIFNFFVFDETRFCMCYQDNGTANYSFVMFGVDDLVISAGPTFLDPRNGYWGGTAHLGIRSDTMNNGIVSLFKHYEIGAGYHTLYFFSVSGLIIGATSYNIHTIGSSYSADFFMVGKKSMYGVFNNGNYNSFSLHVNGSGNIIYTFLGSGNNSSMYGTFSSYFITKMSGYNIGIFSKLVGGSGSSYNYILGACFFNKKTNEVSKMIAFDNFTYGTDYGSILKINSKFFKFGNISYSFTNYMIDGDNIIKNPSRFIESNNRIFNVLDKIYLRIVDNSVYLISDVFLNENLGIYKDGKLRLKGVVEVPGVEKGKEYGVMNDSILVEDGYRNLGIAIDDGLFLLK